MLLHPLALSARVWEPALHELAGGREVIAVDLRGHGDSAWQAKPFTLEDMADDVAALVAALDFQQCDIAGMSMGGGVGMTLAAKYPTLVRRLALCDTTAWYGPGAVAAWEERARVAETTKRQDLIPFQLDRWFREDFCKQHPAIVQDVVAAFLRTDRAVHAHACRAMGAFDARPLLGDIRATTCVITGQEDYATPVAMGQDLARAIRGAKFLVWENTRHFAVLESVLLRRYLADFFANFK